MSNDDYASFVRRSGHDGCLLCGGQNPCSLKLHFQAAEDGSVRGQFRGNPKLQGYEGILHGGVIAALLDEAMSHCVLRRGVQGVTGDLHVRLVHSVSVDALLDIKAWIVLSRPPFFRVRAELAHEGVLMAWAEGKFVQR